jgi:hypothetical protein
MKAKSFISHELAQQNQKQQAIIEVLLEKFAHLDDDAK